MRTFLAATVLVLALVAAGCGGSGSTTPATTVHHLDMAMMPAAKVLSLSVKAADSASSMHMSGNIKSGGKTIGIDLSIAKGNGATGSMTINGHKVDIEVIGKNGYMKGDGSFWKQFGGSAGATIATLLQGKWLKFPVNNAQFRPLIAFASANALFDKLKSGASMGINNAGLTDYKGQQVVAIKDTAENGTFYVRASGTPYPVALVKEGADAGTISWSDWNKPVTLTPPTDVLDFSNLTG